MARTKEKPESASAYFKRLFEENPDWLGPGSNQAVVDRWQADHAGQTLTSNLKSIMSNVKSQMNKKLGRRGRRRKRRKAGAGVEAVAAPRPAAVTRTRAPLQALEDLESRLDECLSIARRQEEVEGFDNVIKHLRQARNGVVWAIGQPTFKS
jgi:hypothetical protein